MSYDRGRENPEYHYRSPELEGVMVQVFEHLFENVYRDRRIDVDMRDTAIDIARSNSRDLVYEMTDVIRDRTRDDYIRLSEVVDWVRHDKSRDILADAKYILDKEYEESRRDRDRNYRSRDRDSRGRSNSRVSARNLEVPRIGLSGARRGDTTRDTPYERSEDRRSRLAREGSEDLQQRRYNDGVNRPNAEHIEAPAKSNKTDRPGDTVYDTYAIVAGSCGEPLSIVANPAAITETTCNLYKQTNKVNALVGGTVAIQSTKLDVHTPVTTFENAAALVEFDDATIFQPENFCHFFNYHRVAIHRHDGSGEDVLRANTLISAIVSESKGTVNERLAAIAAKLNEVQVWTRKLFVARVLRRWNTYARCNMVIPSTPDQCLLARNWEQLMSLFPDAQVVDNDLGNRMEQVLKFYNTTEYTAYIKDGMDWVLRSVFGGRNGFVDVRNNNLEYVAIDDKVPFVIDRKYRARELYKMNADQQKQLGAMFTKDWFCSVDQATAVITNLSLSEVMPHPRINCISTTDSPIVQILRSSMKKSHRAYPVFSYDKSTGKIDYTCHAGLLPTGDVMMVKLQEHA